MSHLAPTNSGLSHVLGTPLLDSWPPLGLTGLARPPGWESGPWTLSPKQLAEGPRLSQLSSLVLRCPF